MVKFALMMLFKFVEGVIITLCEKESISAGSFIRHQRFCLFQVVFQLIWSLVPRMNLKNYYYSHGRVTKNLSWYKLYLDDYYTQVKSDWQYSSCISRGIETFPVKCNSFPVSFLRSFHHSNFLQKVPPVLLIFHEASSDFYVNLCRNTFQINVATSPAHHTSSSRHCGCGQCDPEYLKQSRQPCPHYIYNRKMSWPMMCHSCGYVRRTRN